MKTTNMNLERIHEADTILADKISQAVGELNKVCHEAEMEGLQVTISIKEMHLTIGEVEPRQIVDVKVRRAIYPTRLQAHLRGRGVK